MANINAVEFQNIWLQVYGQKLNQNEATEIAADLVAYFRILAEMERQQMSEPNTKM